MTIAVTSAASYPGAHMVLRLRESSEQFIAIDDPAAGPRLPLAIGEDMLSIPMDDPTALATALNRHGVEEVIHFAGSGTIVQSLNDPLKCYAENTVATFGLMKACVSAGVKRIVFSSTSSVYGVPEVMPIDEDTPLNPISPFGSSMAMAERILQDVAGNNRITYVVLRYFNVAGADPAGRAGEMGKPRHLVKVVSQIAAGTRREKLQIYGNDYPTPDGTCIRDYIHVSDLADAHFAALEYLRAGRRSCILNCGYGYGASVLEVVQAVERETGQRVPLEYGPRRPGDPPQLIADNAAIRSTLDWTPRYDDIDFIVRTAIDWEAKCRSLAA